MNSIKVQLLDSEMVELHAVYQRLIKEYKMSSRHCLLLRGHITEFAEWISGQVRICKKKCTIRLEGTSLLAFVQLWEEGGTLPGGAYDTCGLELTYYQGNMIQKFFDQLGQMAPKRKSYAAIN